MRGCDSCTLELRQRTGQHCRPLTANVLLSLTPAAPVSGQESPLETGGRSRGELVAVAISGKIGIIRVATGIASVEGLLIGFIE